MTQELKFSLQDDTQVIPADEFSAWYLKSLEEAQFFDYGPVRGTMVVRPNGYAMWEIMWQELDRRLKAVGVQNAYFPMFIPESFIAKEKKHVEGFSPELAVVTHAGGESLDEPLVVRPTSETMFYHMFEKWIKSYKQLPLKINQWANVVRWEKRTRPFSRTTEFLWQEGHTVHQTEQEAAECAQLHLKVYKDFYEEFLAVPVVSGRKTDAEKFAGAKVTYTLEPMMRDGKALQTGTSHLLEQSFPASFGVKFQDDSGKMQTPWCTSWGTTTRMIAMTVMVHGDNKGLVIPPKVAPVQVAIVPILKKNQDQAELISFVNELAGDLRAAGIRVQVFDDASQSAGSRFFECEKLGIPMRIEVGQRDLDNGSAMVAWRMGMDKQSVALSQLTQHAVSGLEKYHQFLLKRAERFLQGNIKQVDSFEQIASGLKSSNAFYKVAWCTDNECEKKLRDIQASIRVTLDDTVESGKNCFVCQNSATTWVIAAKAY